MESQKVRDSAVLTDAARAVGVRHHRPATYRGSPFRDLHHGGDRSALPRSSLRNVGHSNPTGGPPHELVGLDRLVVQHVTKDAKARFVRSGLDHAVQAHFVTLSFFLMDFLTWLASPA